MEMAGHEDVSTYLKDKLALKTMLNHKEEEITKYFENH